jgi:hypothetical protein
MPITAYLEDSGTPIFARIAKALGTQLAAAGLNALLIKPSGFDQASYLAYLRSLGADTVYISNAQRNIIQHRLPGKPTHYFEHFAGRLVFLHQDSILSSHEFAAGLSLFQAWQRIAGRSLHLCIEPSSVQTLQAAGISNVHLVPHASEIVPAVPPGEGFAQALSFVGHVLPSEYHQSSGSASVDALVQRLFERRQADFSASLQAELERFTASALEGLASEAENTVFRQVYAMWLRRELKLQSMRFRGWVFEAAELESVDIVGGDPGYIVGVDRSLRIEREHLRYRAPEYELTALNRIYSSSLVSLNITSLQFDHAVVNRFHDVFLAGGLCLTDRREGLAGLTGHHAELSFASLPEMEERVRYWSRPDKRRERALLIAAVQQEIVAKSGYPRLVQEIRRFLAAPLP